MSGERSDRLTAQTRRRFLTTAGVTGAAVLGSTAGCLDLLGLTPRGGAGGAASLGAGAAFPDVSEEDATDYATTGDELDQLAGSGGGRIIWIPEDVQIDLTGRTITVENAWVASGRTQESTGAVIFDEGRGAPGEHISFILEHGGRLSGLTIRGALHNYTDSAIIPGYVPLGEGGSYDARQRWRDDWYCRAAEVHGDEAQIDNCEIWGFSTGIAVGRRRSPVSPNILYNHIHNCMMTSDGYPIHVNDGMPSIHGCTFNAYRHAVNGFGPPTAGYIVTECLFGPYKSSHDIDMHRLEENIGGDGDPSSDEYANRAGGTMVIRDCTIMGTNVVDDRHHNGGANMGTYSPTPYINHNKGGRTPHVHLRGIPADRFIFENNQCAYADPVDAINQHVPGSYSADANGWHEVHIGGNAWGIDSGTGV